MRARNNIIEVSTSVYISALNWDAIDEDETLGQAKI